MHSLVSVLPEPFYTQVTTLWQELERDPGLVGMMEYPFFPHFTWYIAEDYGEGYGFERTEALVQEMTQQFSPFLVRTTGLGLFVNEKAVVYVPMVKTAQLARLHALAWEHMEKACIGRTALYAPERWMPHISLTYEGNIGRVMERLAFQTFDWEMVIDNIILLDWSAGISVIRFSS